MLNPPPQLFILIPIDHKIEYSIKEFSDLSVFLWIQIRFTDELLNLDVPSKGNINLHYQLNHQRRVQ